MIRKLLSSIPVQNPATLKRPSLKLWTGILTILFITSAITQSAEASEISLETPMGVQIKGTLTKKSPNQIEVQTDHGVVELRRKDLTERAWIKAQSTITSHPKPIKNSDFVPKVRTPKEIRVSSQPKEDKPIPIPYTGFLQNNSNGSTPQTPQTPQSNNTKPNEPHSALYINTLEEKPWTLDAPNTKIPAYEIIPISEQEAPHDIKQGNQNSLSKDLLEKSRKDAMRVFLPLTIVALSLVLLAKSNLPLRTKIASYVILGFLLLSIAIENTLFGVISIAILCLLMLLLEILNNRKKAIEEALNLKTFQTQDPKKEIKVPNSKNCQIQTEHLANLEWKKFEEFCCLWLEEQDFEITQTKTMSTQSSNRLILGTCPSKEKESRLVTGLNTQNDKIDKPRGKGFKATYRGSGRPMGIKEIKEIKKACLSTETPMAISLTGFSPEAINWAKDDKVRIISSKELTDRFKSFKHQSKVRIISEIWDGKQSVPSCPVCNKKMDILREILDPKKGFNTKFWYCENYDTCHQREMLKTNNPIKEDKIYPDFSKEE